MELHKRALYCLSSSRRNSRLERFLLLLSKILIRLLYLLSVRQKLKYVIKEKDEDNEFELFSFCTITHLFIVSKVTRVSDLSYSPDLSLDHYLLSKLNKEH